MSSDARFSTSVSHAYVVVCLPLPCTWQMLQFLRLLNCLSCIFVGGLYLQATWKRLSSWVPSFTWVPELFTLFYLDYMKCGWSMWLIRIFNISGALFRNRRQHYQGKFFCLLLETSLSIYGFLGNPKEHEHWKILTTFTLQHVFVWLGTCLHLLNIEWCFFDFQSIRFWTIWQLDQKTCDKNLPTGSNYTISLPLKNLQINLCSHAWTSTNDSLQ